MTQYTLASLNAYVKNKQLWVCLDDPGRDPWRASLTPLQGDHRISYWCMFQSFTAGMAAIQRPAEEHLFFDNVQSWAAQTSNHGTGGAIPVQVCDADGHVKTQTFSFMQAHPWHDY